MYKVVPGDAREFIEIHVRNRFQIKECIFDPTTSNQNKKNADRFDSYEAVLFAGD